MKASSPGNNAGFWFLLIVGLLIIVVIVSVEPFQAANNNAVVATYSHGVLYVTIPYHAPRAGMGRLTLEVLDPEDEVVGRAERRLDIAGGTGRWQTEVRLDKEPALDDLVWHRVRYRFEYGDRREVGLEGTESISQILRMPVVHILGQQSYLTGGLAAVRVIVTDSKNEVIPGAGTVRIDLAVGDQKSRVLFLGRLN